MLFTKDVLEKIAAGSITLAFRRWRRPTVRSGGTLQTPAGLLQIRAVELVEEDAITRAAAAKAGFESVAAVTATLRPDGELYRIQFRRIGDDPRIALRENRQLTDNDLVDIRTRLKRLDARSKVGDWTEKILRLIASHPQHRAADVAEISGFEKEWLKTNIRKLKNLGLTESLQTGYQLSPRGHAFLAAIDGE